MKVLAYQNDKNIIASMSVSELIQLAGFNYSDDFNKLVGIDVTSFNDSIRYQDTGYKAKLLEIDIPVSQIFKDAKDTLNEYQKLKTQLESIRNQLSNLTGKMEKAKAPDKKK